jgi:hypothetical protein
MPKTGSEKYDKFVYICPKFAAVTAAERYVKIVSEPA